MSTLRVNTLQNAAGTGTPAIDGLAKAWVNFNGTGTVAIRAAFNVSSITDLGTGSYRVNFTNNMENSNYSVNVQVGSGIVPTRITTAVAPTATPSVSSVSMGSWIGAADDTQGGFTATDFAYVSAAIFA